MNNEQRIAQLEKEVADLKRRLENQPKIISFDFKVQNFKELMPRVVQELHRQFGR